MKLPKTGDSHRYERITPRGMFFGLEELRVRLEATTGRVDVGWVQADSLEDVASFSQTATSDWAERVVWPRMDAK